MGYHTLVLDWTNGGVEARPTATLSASSRSTPVSTSGGGDVWDVRATKTPISGLHLLTHNAKHLPVSRIRSANEVQPSPNHRQHHLRRRQPRVSINDLPDEALLRIFSFLDDSAQLVRCSRVSRRFYFLSWDPRLWRTMTLSGPEVEADLALKTLMRLLARNAGPATSGVCVESLSLTGCSRLTDRGLAIVARRCPGLRRLEVRGCSSVTNGGVMDLATRCSSLNHLDLSGE